MPTSDLRQAYYNILLEQVRSFRYPSPTMMERLERDVRNRGEAEEYVGALLDLAADERYPSPQLLDRISSAVSILERSP